MGATPLLSAYATEVILYPEWYGVNQSELCSQIVRLPIYVFYFVYPAAFAIFDQPPFLMPQCLLDPFQS